MSLSNRVFVGTVGILPIWTVLVMRFQSSHQSIDSCGLVADACNFTVNPWKCEYSHLSQ